MWREAVTYRTTTFLFGAGLPLPYVEQGDEMRLESGPLAACEPAHMLHVPRFPSVVIEQGRVAHLTPARYGASGEQGLIPIPIHRVCFCLARLGLANRIRKEHVGLGAPEQRASSTRLSTPGA